MWDDCGFYPRTVVNVLERRSLITIGDDDMLRMHDQLRDLGRQIAREGKLDEWGRWSRLWDSDKAFEVFRSGQGTEKVKALCLDLNPSIFPKSCNFFYYWAHSDMHELEVEKFNPRHLDGEKFLRLPHLSGIFSDSSLTLYGIDRLLNLEDILYLQGKNMSEGKLNITFALVFG
ncbi:hypothetical protein LguiA_029975 [Lonicera macranthoides]